MKDDVVAFRKFIQHTSLLCRTNYTQASTPVDTPATETVRHLPGGAHFFITKMRTH